MTARLFDHRLSEEWIGFTILRRVIIAAAIVHFSLAAVSGYRAIVQVYRVAIESSSLNLTTGSPVTARIVTSGRTFVNAKLELIQRGQAATIASVLVRENDFFFYDPRPHREAFVALVPRDVFTRFKPGTAVLRLTAAGRSQLLRVPPPKVQEMQIHLR